MQCQAFSPFLSLPFPPLILSFFPQPHFIVTPLLALFLSLLYALSPIPRARLQHLVAYLHVSLSLSLHLLSLLALSLIRYLPLSAIPVYLSLSI